MVAGSKSHLLNSSSSTTTTTIPRVGSTLSNSGPSNILSLVHKISRQPLVLLATEKKVSQAWNQDHPTTRQQQAPAQRQEDHLSLADLEQVPPLSDAWPGLQTCLNIDNITSDHEYTFRNKKIKTLHPQKDMLECEYCEMKFSVKILMQFHKGGVTKKKKTKNFGTKAKFHSKRSK